MNDRLRRALDRKISAHNRLAWLVTSGMALGIIVLWAALFFVVWWLTVLLITVTQGLDANVPARLPHWIAVIFLGWLGLGWIDRGRDNSLRDTRAWWESALNFLLIPTRFTFSIYQQFSSRVCLSEAELATATEFLEKLFRAGRMSEESIDEALPDEAAREHILTALRTTDLVIVRERGGQEYLKVANPERLVPFLQ